ncbi:serine-rich adhesin for platelets-like isoform X2 [Littorina saxatilis]
MDEGNTQTSDSGQGGEGGADGEVVGPMVSEMSHGDEVVQAAEEFERRSRKMKDHLTVKAEAEPGPSKREEWMTELPPEMGKTIGVTARTFSNKGGGTTDDKDRSDWTDTPADKIKKEKEGGKSKKRKRDEGEKNVVKQRDDQLQQQIEEYNKKKRPESLVEMHQKSKKKKKSNNQNQNTAADSTQPQASAQQQTQTIQQLTPQQQQQLQQQQVVTANGDQLQFMPITDDIRDSLDLLSTDQKQSEYYSGEFQNTEYNEAKPLADLLLNQNMVGYQQQDGTLLSQSGQVLGTSQMIAQAYNQAQQLSTTSLNQHQLMASGLGGQMGITIIPHPSQDGQEGQTAVLTDDSQGQTIQTINGTTYAAGNIVGSSQGNSISAFPLGQNVIIASPGTQQAGNFIFTSTGQMASGMGQNIVIAAPGQQGGYIVKQETQEELAQTLVLASQNPQQSMGTNVIMASTPHTATLSDGTNVVFTHPPPSAIPTSEGHAGRAVTVTSKALTGAISAAGGTTFQTQGGMSLVLPPGSFLPQLQSMPTAQSAVAAAASPNLLQMSAKLDKMMIMMQETVRAISETNKRLDRLEAQLTMNPPSNKAKKKSASSSATSTSTTTSSASSSSTSDAVQSKSELKAALADYLTITDFNNKDELKRNESSSDLFIPVGTVSLPIQDSPSPSGETATSTVAELPDRNLLVLNNAAPVPIQPDVAAAPDSQSGIAVTIYDTEGATYELGPDSSKDTAGAKFTTVSQNPKTVIVDPKFWEMLVEDFQKNMTSKQIMSALTNIRKPLVRNMGNNEISICSSVLKEAEEACQGRRERLAKELVFRIFTLGEVYDRNVSGVFYIKGKKMENKHKALDPAKMSAIRFLVMRYPPSVLDNPRLEKLVWKNCVDRINDALRRIYNWIHKLVDIQTIIDKLPTGSVLQTP